MKDKQEAEKKPPANELAYWTETLAEPELLKRGVMLNFHADGWAFAVPIGKLRQGGDIQFVRKRVAQEAFKLLSGKKGFPNLQVIRGRHSLTRKAMAYYGVRWGDRPPFDGWDWGDPICGLLLGVHYGYRSKAIADLVELYQKTRRLFNRTTILALIEASRCHM